MLVNASARHHGVELKMSESNYDATRSDFSLGDRKLQSVGTHPSVPSQAIAA